MSDPEKQDAPGWRARGAANEQRTVDGANCGAVTLGAQETMPVAVSKPLATLRAGAALAGWTLEADANGLIAGRWGQVRHRPDLAAAEGFFREIGVIS